MAGNHNIGHAITAGFEGAGGFEGEIEALELAVEDVAVVALLKAAQSPAYLAAVAEETKGIRAELETVRGAGYRLRRDGGR